jgi:hypothetical protein
MVDKYLLPKIAFYPLTEYGNKPKYGFTLCKNKKSLENLTVPSDLHIFATVSKLFEKRENTVS